MHDRPRTSPTRFPRPVREYEEWGARDAKIEGSGRSRSQVGDRYPTQTLENIRRRIGGRFVQGFRDELQALL